MRPVTILLIFAAALAAADYRHPIVFGRSHSDEKLQSKIWKVDLAGRRFTELTRGGRKYESTRPRM